ncbi:MAG: NAD-dependent epimerase/dehydratase family protein [Candidatus Pacebacteria bacterium]|nr:NAD-dependent epimerase/dehydratase family protein [Candidatus Paceibacterota bacterium]
MVEKKTALITGGSGFVGTNLTQRLLGLNYRVLSLDNFYSSDSENTELFTNNPDYSFICHDVRRPLPVKEKVDMIFHLACPASPPVYQKDPLFTLETAVLGVQNVLKLAQKNNCPLFFASTSEIYGDPLSHPQKETDWGHVNPIGPRSCYDEGKRIGETFCREYARLGVDVRVGRIFNTYGPFMNPKDGRVVSNFINQALAGKPLTVYGKGEQTRSFCYISDLLDGILAVINLGKSNFGPFNLGNSEEVTILKLAKTVLRLVPESKSKIKYLLLPIDDPRQRRPSLRKAVKVLRWRPKVSLEQGLEKTVSFFKKNEKRFL